MASLTVPAQVPSVAEDSEQLRSAFKGIMCILINFALFSTKLGALLNSTYYTNIQIHYFGLSSIFSTLVLILFATFCDCRDLNFLD